jgi:carbon-monoxide dehydrogenase medium subunit
MYPRAFHEDARLLAGGASLIPLMKLRLAAPTVVVDIGRLDELAGVAWRDGRLVVGALTRHADLEDDPTIAAALPVLAEVAASVGDAQVRNMGTVGGALAEADPAGDWAPALLALGGSVRAVGPSGARTIAAADLFVDAYTTALAPDEVLVEASFPLPGPRSGGAHLKFEVRAGDFAVANCAVAVTLDDADRCAAVGIGLGGVGLRPERVAAAEALLQGQAPAADVVAAAAEAVRQCTESFDDVRGSAAYRQHLGGVLFERALTLALERARGTAP